MQRLRRFRHAATSPEIWSKGLRVATRRIITTFGRHVVVETGSNACGLGKSLKRSRDAVTSSQDDLYAKWIIENEIIEGDLDLQKQLAQRFTYQPLISIITPVYDPDPAALGEMLQSVCTQTYENWEVCLVDGNSGLPSVRRILKEFANNERRVHLISLEQNLGISGNSNVGLEKATGDYVAFLDHDDTLAPFALFEVVQLLNQDKGWDLIYSDHDVLTADGRSRIQPLFKPDWSPEIMLSANYITHLTVIRATLVKEVVGFDPDTDGAQDWDLFFRVVERTHRVAHIPKVLYHWRESVGSTAANIYAKAYAPPAQLRVIQAHLSRQGLPDPKVFFNNSGFIRVAWSPSSKNKISIIIPTKGANRLLENCVNSILTRSAYPDFEIIIVNNGERKPTEFKYYQQVVRDKRVRILHFDAPFNYSAVNNFGARHATGNILLFLNNDTQVINQDWLDELASWAGRREVGVVGAKLLRPGGIIQHAGVIIGLTGFAGHVFGGTREGHLGLYGLTEWYRNFLAVTGACMTVRREIFEQLSGFNEQFLLCGSDVEFCLRVRAAGYRVVYNPFAKLRHIESATHKGAIPLQDFQISYNYYLPTLESGDPYYNPNLSYWNLEPTLRKEGETLPLDFVKNFLRAEKGGNDANGTR